ncbi:hypothetical protein Ate01nite_58800 [Actinoplanes teichomyceticus]|nr:hypothetical protein Ate01nite_58800 [Actinoplanes teichomyceticus]
MHLAQYRFDSGTCGSAISVPAGSTWAIGAISTRPLPNRRLDPLRPLPRRLPPVRVDSAPLRDEPRVSARADGPVALRGCGTGVPLPDVPPAGVPPDAAPAGVPPPVAPLTGWGAGVSAAGARPHVSQ